jgi:hypothetical protein
VLGLDRGYSAHSIRAAFITTALENPAQLEDMQKGRGAPRPEHHQTDTDFLVVVAYPPPQGFRIYRTST